MLKLQELKNKLFAALAEYEYEQSKLDDKTAELATTCARLANENADLKEKVAELTAVIEKQLTCCPPESEKKVIHG